MFAHQCLKAEEMLAFVCGVHQYAKCLLKYEVMKATEVLKWISAVQWISCDCFVPVRDWLRSLSSQWFWPSPGAEALGSPSLAANWTTATTYRKSSTILPRQMDDSEQETGSSRWADTHSLFTNLMFMWAVCGSYCDQLFAGKRTRCYKCGRWCCHDDSQVISKKTEYDAGESGHQPCGPTFLWQPAWYSSPQDTFRTAGWGTVSRVLKVWPHHWGYLIVFT